MGRPERALSCFPPAFASHPKPDPPQQIGYDACWLETRKTLLYSPLASSPTVCLKSLSCAAPRHTLLFYFDFLNCTLFHPFSSFAQFVHLVHFFLQGQTLYSATQTPLTNDFRRSADYQFSSRKIPQTLRDILSPRLILARCPLFPLERPSFGVTWDVGIVHA